MVVKYQKAHTFADVKPGEVFSYANGCGHEMEYMKIEDVYVDGNKKCNAVLLREGSLGEFADNAPVVILKGSFVVGD